MFYLYWLIRCTEQTCYYNNTIKIFISISGEIEVGSPPAPFVTNIIIDIFMQNVWWKWISFEVKLVNKWILFFIYFMRIIGSALCIYSLCFITAAGLNSWLLAILSIIFIATESSSFQVGISMRGVTGVGGHPTPLWNFNF